MGINQLDDVGQTVARYHGYRGLIELGNSLPPSIAQIVANWRHGFLDCSSETSINLRQGYEVEKRRQRAESSAERAALLDAIANDDYSYDEMESHRRGPCQRAKCYIGGYREYSLQS